MIALLSTNGPTFCEAGAAPTKLIVATLTGADILERSSPSAPWRHVAHVLEGKHVSALMKPPGDRGIFASIHGGGIWHSTDEGETWSPRDKGVTINHVYSLGYNDTPDGMVLYCGTEPVSLFSSTDNGASWTELPAISKVPGHETWRFPPPPHLAHTKSYLFDKRDPNSFYVGIEQGALLLTKDGGKSWRELDSFWRATDVWPKDIHRVVRNPKDPENLFMATGNGLFVTKDGGETWTELTTMQFRIGYPDQVMFSPANDGVIFMSGAERDPSTWRKSHEAHGTVLRSRDGGKSWEDANAGLPNTGRANIEAFNATVWPGGYLLLVGNTDGEVYSSENGGNSWTQVVQGLRPVSKGGHFRNLHSLVEVP
jgi:photosystem II stability/assembly factor-like uncharacterized protein